jgi:hypothetical protein
MSKTNMNCAAIAAILHSLKRTRGGVYFLYNTIPLFNLKTKGTKHKLPPLLADRFF